MQHAQTQPIRELEARGYTGEIRNTLRPALNNNGTPLLQHIRGARVLARFVLAFTLLSFMTVDVTWARTQGELAAAQIPVVQSHNPVPQNLAQALRQLQETVRVRRHAVHQAAEERSGFIDGVLNTLGLSQLGTEDMSDVTGLVAGVQQWHGRQQEEFAQTEAKLKAKNLPEVIRQRHRDAVAKVAAGKAALQVRIDELVAAESLRDQDIALGRLQEALDAEQFTRSPEPFDPSAPLPFGPADPVTPRAPDSTRDPVSAAMSSGERARAQTERALALLGDTLISPAQAAVPFTAPDAADLAPTTEVVINAAIQQKAAELNHQPVAIYNWVRNHVEWVPTHGAIQTADMTLAAQRGNAFDIASLLIALLRASNVPARYAYGTVEIPAAKVQNWVGGVNTPGAAQQVLGQGGIPNAALTEGGKVTSLQLEHVWVEAYVDFEPSRGSKHVTGDSWIPLDASYKQYDHTAGMDLATQVPFDAQSLLNDLQATATTNEAEGWVQNVDQTLIQQRFEQYKTQVESYITSQNPDATVGEVLGTRQTIVFEPQTLAAGLPYALTAVTARYSAIPTQLQHKYTVSLAEKSPIAIATGSKILSVTMPLSRAANSAVALSFVPATAADEETLLSFLPDAEAGGTIDPNALPTELPGYLIHIKAQLTLDGEVIAQGGEFAMGTELEIAHTLFDPRRSIPTTRSVVIAGEYLAIGVDSGQINPLLLSKTKVQLEQAKAELEAIRTQIEGGEDPSVSAFLTKHVQVGGLLQMGILSYFAINDSLDQLDARSLKVVTRRLPSFGTFATSLEPTYLYGVPRSVKLAGLSMDVDRISTMAASKADNHQEDIAFFRATGSRKSAFEHLVPERFFSTSEVSAQAISAVKALALAASQGQKIYTLTKANQSQLNSLAISTAAKQDVAAALNANKEVTVHQSPITYAGWTGEGYIVIDPSTGAGAYKISGGGNGGQILADSIKMVSDAVFEGISAYTDFKDGSGRFSDRVKQAMRYNKLLSAYGGVALAVDAFEIMLDDKLTYTQKFGQLMTLLLAAATTAEVALLLAAPNLVVGALIVFIASIAMSILADYLNEKFFTRIEYSRGRRKSWA